MPQQMESMMLPPRLPLVVQTQNRARTVGKDARLVNCYIETDEAGELWVYKRPGILEASNIGTANGRGGWYWRGDSYFIFNGTLYRNGVSVGTGLDQTNGTYRFSSILGATPKLVFGNGAKTYAYTVAGGITLDLHTIDVDFPAATVKGIVYLNGATYVMDSSGQIWGSAVNSVSISGDWSALNFIAAQIEPDSGVALAKQQVYVIALGEWSTEIFFDAGNTTGSPLGNVQGSKISFGCATAESLQEIGDQLFWISSTRSGAVQASMMEALNHQIISTESIDRLLQSSTLEDVASLQLKIDGHTFWVITLRDVNLTLAYDITENQWHQWTDADGNYFPYLAYSYDSSKRHILQHETNGTTAYVSSDYASDDADLIVVDIYTPLFDANTRRRKQMNMLTFVGDQVTGSVLEVRHSDDDYQSWSNFRKVYLSQKSPKLMNCGTFEKRAYHFRHRCNTRFRMQAVEVQYDIGQL